MLTPLQTEETSMHNESLQKPEDPRQTPWNKGKLIGSKPPLRTKDVWSIRTKLQVEKRIRDLATFNLAIDSKLRGCDVVSLKVEDVAPHGMTLDRAPVRQRKTGHPVRFELSEQTREAVDDYIRSAPRRAGEVEALLRTVLERLKAYLNVDFSSLPYSRLSHIREPGVFADAIAPLMPIEIGQRQDLLETGNATARLEKILALMKNDSRAA
jgi:ATP-dependent Lon protease